MNGIGILLSVLALLELSQASVCPFSGVSYETESSFKENENRLVDLVADAGTTTPSGCTCTSLCSCVECDPGRPSPFGETRDSCSTADECGEYSLTRGYWDYCLYLNSAIPEYSSLGWEEKTNLIMEKVMAEQSEGKYPYDGVHGCDAPEFIWTSMVTTYENEWDWAPAGRIRYNHCVGAVCKFTMNIKDSPYTGLLKDGVTTGIIRISLIQNSVMDEHYIPSAAVKFLRTGATSANYFGLPQVDERSNNIFSDEYKLLNHIRNSTSTFIGNPQIVKKLLQGDDCFSMVGLSDITRYDQEGNEEEKPIFPYRITLQPTGDVNFKEEWLPIDDFLQQFKDEIPDGSTLYSVITHEDPLDEVGTELAQMTVVDGCFPSKYGDEHLFFQHKSGFDDAKLRPEWESYYKTGCIGCHDTPCTDPVLDKGQGYWPDI